MTHAVRQTNQALREAATRLVEERDARRHRPRLHLVEPRVPRPRGAS